MDGREQSGCWRRPQWRLAEDGGGEQSKTDSLGSVLEVELLECAVPSMWGAQGREESGAPPASGWAAGWVQRREVGKRARWAWVVQLMLPPPPQDHHRTVGGGGVTPTPRARPPGRGTRDRVLASLDRTTKSWSI